MRAMNAHKNPSTAGGADPITHGDVRYPTTDPEWVRTTDLSLRRAALYPN
jgi:hypothetical protein